MAARLQAEHALEELETRAMERRSGGLRLFVQHAWPLLDPATPFAGGFYIDAICDHLEAVTRGELRDLIILMPPRFGKALDVDTPVLTTWGWRHHGDLAPGDFVFAPDGRPVRVLAATPHHIEHAWDLQFDDGSTITAGDRHLWDVERDLSETPRCRRAMQVSTHDLRDGARPDAIRLHQPVQFPPRRLLIDPYTLGAWLGDGATDNGSVYAAAQDVAEMSAIGEIASVAPRPGGQDFFRIRVHGLQTKLRVLGLLGHKHIPLDYLEASIEQRYALLQGLMDTDGDCHQASGYCSFTTALPELARQMRLLVQSLGLKAYSSQRYTTLNGKRYGPHFRIRFASHETPVFRLARKQARVKPAIAARTFRRYLKAKTPAGARTVNCIQVEGGRYLAGRDLIATHNSKLVAVYWPAWEWGPANLPHYRWLFNTYALALTLRDSGYRRQVMESSWYKRRWSTRFTLGQERFRPDTASKYENDHSGFHLATSVGGGNTGEGGHRLVVDDALGAQDAYSEAARDNVIRWWTVVMPSRRNDATAARVIVQQRLHERDLAGFLMAEEGGYTVLSLPNEFDPKRRCVTRWFRDPREEPGDLLCEARLTRAQTEELKSPVLGLGEYDYAQQYQQLTVPPEGGILKEKWWRYWVPPFHELVGKPDEFGRPILALPKVFHQRLQTWDMTFKKTATGSYVCGLAWGRRFTNAFLLQMFRERVGFVDTVTAVEDMARDYPSQGIYVEGKANGPAVIDSLRLKVPGLVEHDVSESKEARAHAASPHVQAGNYVLPHPAIRSWTATIRAETRAFPNAAHDDIVDCITLADRYLFLQQPFSEKNFAQRSDHGI